METSSTIFPESLVFCGLAERSYLALRKLKNRTILKNTEKEAMKEAIFFLKNAIHGKKAIENLELGENALVASYAFKEAFSATITAFQDTGKDGVEPILNFFDKLIRHLNLITEDKRIKDEDIDELILFFSQVRDLTLRSHAGSFDSFVTRTDLYANNSR